MPPLARALSLSFVLASSSGCLSAGVFSTARVVPRGELEHLAALDVPITVVDRDDGDESSDTEVIQTRLGSGGGPQPSYGVRYGALSWAELGGRVGPTFVEVHSKLTMFDTPGFAVAVSPRLTSAGNLPGDTPYYARLPVLVTVGPADGVTLTPRIGLGQRSATRSVNPPARAPCPGARAIRSSKQGSR